MFRRHYFFHLRRKAIQLDIVKDCASEWRKQVWRYQ
ncbi:unnamed protein product, partial [Brassica oleracea]